PACRKVMSERPLCVLLSSTMPPARGLLSTFTPEGLLHRPGEPPPNQLAGQRGILKLLLPIHGEVALPHAVGKYRRLRRGWGAPEGSSNPRSSESSRSLTKAPAGSGMRKAG